MTTLDERSILDERATDQEPAEHFGLEIELMAWWDRAWLARATVAGDTVFSCVVERPSPGLTVLHECLPQRVDLRSTEILMAVARRVRADSGPADLVAIHPASWDEQLAAHGVKPLHRMAYLGLLLEEDQLRAHYRPLPDGYRMTALRAASEVELAGLSREPDRPKDLAVWRDVLSGSYGPIIDDASLVISTNSGICAAIAVSQHRGHPLIGHCVTSDEQRGQGLGRTLLVHALRRLSAAGHAECRLHVVEDNWIAQRLYRSVGFTPLRPPLRVSLIPDGG